MLLITGTRFIRLICQTILPSPFPGFSLYLRRIAVLLVLVPLLGISQLVNWLCLLLDELIYPAYRKVEIREPVFVLGTPRSGTTFMHRLLAASEDLTSFSTWECLFAPSICQRQLLHALARLDRLLGRPAARLLALIEARLLASTADVHPTGLFEPEEDYFCFMPLLSCFILILPFPEADWLWRMASFDRDLSPRERNAAMRWYRRCLQRHLWFHGTGKRLLSKNASFAGMAGSIAEHFPDCRIVVCQRDRESVIESQFRSLAPGMKLFAIPESDARFRRRLLDCIEFYYANLNRLAANLPAERLERVPLPELSENTRAVIDTISRKFRLRESADVNNAIHAYEAERSMVHA